MRTDHPTTRPGRPWGGVLVVHYGSHGHTATFAERLAGALRRAGLEVELRDAAAPGGIDPERHDAVVVGASLHRERRREGIVAWLREHRAELDSRPTALLSVRLTGPEGPEERAAAERAVSELLEETGWRPDRAVAVIDAAGLDRFADEVALLAAVPLAS